MQVCVNISEFANSIQIFGKTRSITICHKFCLLNMNSWSNYEALEIKSIGLKHVGLLQITNKYNSEFVST
jgi:hypothetical protein